jgi:hypothetical protein
MAHFIACQRTEHGVPHAVTCHALDVSESLVLQVERPAAHATPAAA